LTSSDKSEELIQDIEEEPSEDRSEIEKEDKAEFTQNGVQIKDEFDVFRGLDLEYDITDTNEILEDFRLDIIVVLAFHSHSPI
jgi:hypothetical protein